MNTDNYYARHPWHSINFYDVPAARRVMDYLVENTTSYPRYVDGRFLSPGRIITTHRRICDDLGISLRDLVTALNRLDLLHLISRQSYPDSIDITITLHPDETTEPNEVGAQYIAPAQPEQTPPPTQNLPNNPEVEAQYIAPAQPEQTPPNPPSLLYGSGQRPRKKPHSGDNFVGTGVSPCKSTPKQTSRVSGDIFVRLRAATPPSKPRRGALVFSPMWSAAQHGVPIQANKNEPRRGGIVIPSKSTRLPPPTHSKWSVALDRHIRIPNHPVAPPIRGAPA